MNFASQDSKQDHPYTCVFTGLSLSCFLFVFLLTKSDGRNLQKNRSTSFNFNKTKQQSRLPKLNVYRIKRECKNLRSMYKPEASEEEE